MEKVEKVNDLIMNFRGYDYKVTYFTANILFKLHGASCSIGDDYIAFLVEDIKSKFQN